MTKTGKPTVKLRSPIAAEHLDGGAARGFPHPTWFCLLVLLCCFWMWVAGTDASRMYHIDDSYVYVLATRLFEKQESLLKVAVEEAKTDLRIRFRPLYRPLWAVRVWLSGTDWYAHSVWNVFCGVVSSLLLASAFLSLGLGLLGTGVCLVVILVGPQVEGFILRFAQEPVGMVLLASAVFSAGWRYNQTGAGWAPRIAFVVSSAFAAFYKESFAALLPSLGVLWIAGSRCARNTGIVDTLRTEWFVLASLFVTLAATAAGFVTSGANRPSNYYSVSTGSMLSIDSWIRMLREMFPRDSAGLVAGGSFVLVILMPIVTRMVIRARGDKPVCRASDDKHLLLLGAAAALIVLSQCAVYSGTGFYLAGRYAVPLAVGLGMMAAVAVCLIRCRALALAVGLLFASAYSWAHWTPMLDIRSDHMRRRAEFGIFVDMVRRVSWGASGNMEKFFLVAWDPRETEELHAFHRVMTKIAGASPYQLLLVPAQRKPAGAEWQGAVQAAMNYYGDAQWGFFKKSGSVHAVFVHRDCDASFRLSEASRHVSPDFARVVLPGNWVVYCRDFK